MAELLQKRLAARSGAAVAVILVASVLQAYFGFRTETKRDLELLTRSASIVEHELDANFRLIDSMLTEVTDRIALDHWPDSAQVSWLTGRLGALPSIDTALVVGLDGNSVGPGIAAQGPVELSVNVQEREYFQYFRSHPEDRNSHVGDPFVSRFGNRFALPVARPFYDRHGRRAGLLRITLDPTLLVSDVMEIAGNGSVAGAVFYSDGSPVADGGLLGPDFTAQILRTGLLARLPSADAGTFEMDEGGGAPPRLVAYRRLPRTHLMALIGMRHAEAYAVWRRETTRNGILSLILSAAILAAGLSLERRDRLRLALESRHQADLAAHRQNLEQQVADRTAELQREIEIRTRTDQALRASRERLRGITDSLFHSVLVYNHAGHTVFANIAARRMLKVEDLEVEGLPLDLLLQVVEGGQALPFDCSPLRDALESGIDVHGTQAVIRIASTGVDLDVSYVCTPLGEEGKRQAVMSFRDITDIKKAQWELLQASRLASVGQLASGIAHEINTPIQYIGNNLSFIGDSVRQLIAMLQQTIGDDGRAAFLVEELPVAIAESLEGVGHITRIVLSMKEFSHPGSASKSLTNINHALDTTLTVSTNVWKHVADIERRYDPDLPLVPCHAGEMNQVFLNLVVNAAHAIEGAGKPLPGRITLSTARRDDHVEITIEDSGTGIPADIREKIFDPFFTTKEVGKGTGQGLAICQDVVIAKHGGTIQVGGADGEGAVFVICLPLDETKE